MTYEDALKASENGQNVMIWTGVSTPRRSKRISELFFSCNSK
jgi:hypothetical protein